MSNFSQDKNSSKYRLIRQIPPESSSLFTVDDFTEFSETYNTGSFTGSFEGDITLKDVLVLPPLRELPNSPSPGSLASLESRDRSSITLYFYNGSKWVLII